MTGKQENIERTVIRRIANLILLFALFGLPLAGQTDTASSKNLPSPVLTEKKASVPADSISSGKENKKVVEKDEEELDHSSRRAMIYAMVLPGLGQAYNKKYYKIPIVYGALGGVSYWVYYNTQGYRQASADYTELQDDRNERYLRAWRRNLELSYITLVGAYALQVLDAYVDANLFYWDVDPDLTVRIQPSIDPVFLPGGLPINNYGFKCKLTF